MEASSRARFHVVKPEQIALAWFQVSVANERLQGRDKEIIYRFEGYSLSEVAMLSRTNVEAKNELLYRVHDKIESTCRNYSRMKPYLKYDELLSKVQYRVFKTMHIYEIQRGSFESFLTVILHQSIRFVEGNAIREYYINRKTFGTRVMSAYSEAALLDSSVQPSPKEGCITRIDVENFLETLTYSDKEIFILYLTGMTFRSIGDIVQKPMSTVAYRIYWMLDVLQVQIWGMKRPPRKEAEKQV